jgi:Ribosomal protein L7/L12 C-terminal domain
MEKYQVKITAIPQASIPLLKALRSISPNLTLVDAKDLRNHLSSQLPFVLIAGIEKEVAEKAVNILQQVNTTAIIEVSNFQVQMVPYLPIYTYRAKVVRWIYLSMLLIMALRVFTYNHFPDTNKLPKSHENSPQIH